MLNELPKDYVFVSERIEAFHQKYPNGSIKTFFLKKGWLNYFIAKVIPDITLPERFFTGSSFGELSTDKAFEKLETNAIGRALNIAGFETKMMPDRTEGEDTIPATTVKWKATLNQIDLIKKKIAKKNISWEQLQDYVKDAYQCDDIENLSKFEASSLIIDLNTEANIIAIKAR